MTTKHAPYDEIFTKIITAKTNKNVIAWCKKLHDKLVSTGHPKAFAEEYADIISTIKLQDKDDCVLTSATRRQFYRLLCQKYQVETRPLQPAE